MLPIATHHSINAAWSGRPTALDEGAATVLLATTEAMAADPQGLVHGGFVFSAADHAAMLAVNHPFVVLAHADVRFKAPVRVGEAVELRARVEATDGRKRTVSVEGRVGEKVVLVGTLTAAVLDQHVLG